MVVGQVCLAGSSQNLSFIHYNGESRISLIGNTVLAASLHFALSLCQPLLFVALLMEERLVLRAGIDCLAGVWDRRKLLGPLDC